MRYAGAFFEGPVPRGERSLPDQAELFAILVRRETADLRRVIYLGQSKNLARLPLYIHPTGINQVYTHCRFVPSETTVSIMVKWRAAVCAAP